MRKYRSRLVFLLGAIAVTSTTTQAQSDMFGRVVETRNVYENSTIRFGDKYRSGTYFVRIIQGKQHKELKLVKISD